MNLLFPDFKKKALTFSYDDGTTQDRRLVKLFDKYGAKATFNLNSSRFGHVGRINHKGFDVSFDIVSKEEIASLYQNHEIAFHGVEHKNMPDLTPGELYEEVVSDIEELQIYTPEPIIGGAYANGRYSDDVVKSLEAFGVDFCRTVKSTYSFDIPENFLKWHPTSHDNDEKIEELCEEFAKETKELKLFYIWGHSFELDKYDSDRWAHIEEILQKTVKSDVWCATNGEICSYIKASRFLVCTEAYIDNPTQITLFCEINGKNYKIEPLERVFFE